MPIKKTLLLDCDGVLYPLTQLPTSKIVDAMKDTYRLDLNLSGKEQQQISEQTRQEGRLGMFNYIKAICDYKKYDFDKFCTNMAERINYSNIDANPTLWQIIERALPYFNIAILTNNSRVHVAKIIERVFNIKLEKLEAKGIKVLDVTATEQEGIFWRKLKKGLRIICRNQGYEPSQTFLFDDTPLNNAAAKEVGMQSVLINKGLNLEQALRNILEREIKMNKKIEQAYEIAQHADVTTPPDSLLLYSISYLPTIENKQMAYAYKEKHPQSYMLDDTECGQQLLALDLDTTGQNSNPPAELIDIWKLASKRFIMAASGNVTAFVNNADSRSTFVSTELPLILQNDNIKLINGMDKIEFAKQFIKIDKNKNFPDALHRENTI